MYNAIAILDISMEIRFNMCAFITNFRHDHALPGWQEIEFQKWCAWGKQQKKMSIQLLYLAPKHCMHAADDFPRRMVPGWESITRLRKTSDENRLFLAKNSY